MHGKGTFFDPRLNDRVQFPIAARERLRANVRNDARPHHAEARARCISISWPFRRPTPPSDSFDAPRRSAARQLFSGQGAVRDVPRAAALHRAGLEHAHAERDRHRRLPGGSLAGRRYRTAPLKGLWTHTKGGFYHDGRFATLREVVEHYDAFMGLALSERQKQDLAEYSEVALDPRPESEIRRQVFRSAVRLNAPSGNVSGFLTRDTRPRSEKVRLCSPRAADTWY